MKVHAQQKTVNKQNRSERLKWNLVIGLGKASLKYVTTVILKPSCAIYSDILLATRNDLGATVCLLIFIEPVIWFEKKRYAVQFFPMQTVSY